MTWQPRWKYHTDGDPLWLRCGGGEQALLFWETEPPFSPGFPAMRDSDWVRLEQSIK